MVGDGFSGALLEGLERRGYRVHQVSTPEQVRDGIGEYRETLGMTHMVATRLRIGEVDEGALVESLQLLAEVVR